MSIGEDHADRLRSLALLEPGWSEGAGQRIDLAAIHLASIVLAHLPGWDAWGVFPTEAGGVLIEYPSLTVETTSVTSIEVNPGGLIDVHVLAMPASEGPHVPVSEAATVSDPLLAARLAIEIRTRATAAVSGVPMTGSRP